MKLTEKIIEERIMTEAPGWKFRNDSLYREFSFKDFVEAFSFMIKVAEAAERLKHHPNWTNVYNSVTIQLSTHSSGGVTDKDFKLAKEINSVV
jgi:4a-hydroxytetrahydrobiopterin dehydratase